MPRFLLPLAVLAALSAGCGSEPPAAPSSPAVPQTTDTPTDFRPDACGKIVGSVTWTGQRPAVPPVSDIRPRPDGSGYDRRELTHPYAPAIDPATFALRGAVVYLRNVPPARAKPWKLDPVRVEFRDSQIVVTQGDRAGRVGFVRRGEPVVFQSSEATFNVLRARGAAFFALAFPEPDKPRERAFDACGRVELSSAAGFPWQAADLFVCDHPYYMVSGADGSYEFAQVPAGTYELVVWHPSWATAATERNPETGMVQRAVYALPLEQVRPVMAVAGRVVVANANLAPPK